jgi:alcohol dehydrogenase
MARAILFHAPGRPLELLDLPVPRPAGAEVLVRVTCCTLCRSDLHTYSGRRQEPTPTVLGHEIVGRIEEFGPDAARVDAVGQIARVGDRVTWAMAVGCGQCFFCADDLPQKCERPYKYGHMGMPAGGPPGGGLAEFVVLVPGTTWFRVPDEVPDKVATPANCATATVAAVVRHAGALAGRTVLVLGAGVLGLTACAMARTAGARAVLACDPVAESRQRATLFGATHTSDPPTVASLVTEMTEGRGVDVAVELAGPAQSVEVGLASLRTGGCLLLAGTVAPVGTVALDPETVVRRLLTIRGVHNYHPRDLAAALAFLAGPGRSFPFASLVTAEYHLADTEQAFAHAQAHPGVRVAVVP